MGVVTGIQPNQTIIIDISTLPVGSTLQAGSVPTYSQDNTTDVAAAVPSPDGLSFSLTGAASFTPGAVLNVTASGVSSDASIGAFSSTVNVPLLAPPEVGASSFDFNQRS